MDCLEGLRNALVRRAPADGPHRVVRHDPGPIVAEIVNAGSLYAHDLALPQLVQILLHRGLIAVADASQHIEAEPAPDHGGGLC